MTDNDRLLGRMLNGAGWIVMSEEKRRQFRRAARVFNMIEEREARDGEQCD